MPEDPCCPASVREFKDGPLLPCLSPAREALPRCSVLLLLTVLVPRRQLMSEQYMPGVKGVCVACKKPGEQDLRLFKLQQPDLPFMLHDGYAA